MSLSGSKTQEYDYEGFKNDYPTYASIVRGYNDAVSGNGSSFNPTAPDQKNRTTGPTIQNEQDLATGTDNSYNNGVLKGMEEHPVSTKWDRFKEGFSEFKDAATGDIKDMQGKWGNNPSTYGFWIGKPLYKVGSFAFNSALSNAMAASQARPLPMEPGQGPDKSAYYEYLAKYRRKKKLPWEKEEDEII